MSSIYRRGKVWWIKYGENGKVVRCSLETKRAGVAKVRQFEFDRSRKPKLSSIEELQKKWLDTIKPSVSHQHWLVIRHRTNKFLTAFPDFTGFAQDQIQAFINGLIPSKAPRTAIGYLRALSAFCRYLVKIGELSDNPCVGVVLPKAQKLPPRFLTEIEVEQTLAMAKAFHIYLPVLTALQTGMRMTELRMIDWADIDLKRRTITIPRTKTNRPRAVPITAKLNAELEKIRHKIGPLFRGEQGGFVGEKQWRELLKPLQEAIPKFRDGHKGTGTAWHLLRHTFASRYVQAGGDIYRLSKILGHSSVTTTQIYAHLAPAHDEIMEKI